MKPTSRTPEGEPNRCPVCGNEFRIEPSSPAGDAPCPCCGQLLWFTGLAARRVLIADNDRTGIETSKAYLSDIDLETRVATNAEEILECVERWHPALLLLNAAIPKGFEVCRKIKGASETRKTMVLMAFELHDLSDIQRAVEAGTNDFIGKPVEKSELLKRVRNLLKLGQITGEYDGLR